MFDIRIYLDKYDENTEHLDSFLISRELEECDYCRRPRQPVSIIKDDKVCEDCTDKLHTLSHRPHAAINSRPLYTPQRSDAIKDLAKVRLYTLNMIDLISQEIQETKDNHKTYKLIMQYKDIVNHLPPHYNVLYTATKRLYNISETNYLHISIIIAARAVISIALNHNLISEEYAKSMCEELSDW